MTEKNVLDIHTEMTKELKLAGGRITKVYVAPDLASAKNTLRKPGVGMAMQVKQDFPDIDFSKSVMVGDSISDMKFGSSLGMKTVFISSTVNCPNLSDQGFSSLHAFATSLKLE